MQIIWNSCASSKFVCNKLFRFGLHDVYNGTERVNYSDSIAVSLPTCPVLEGGRSWSCLTCLPRPGLSRPRGTYQNNKNLLQNLILCREFLCTLSYLGREHGIQNEDVLKLLDQNCGSELVVFWRLGFLIYKRDIY